MTTVAVSQRVDVVSGRNEIRDALDQRLCLLLAEAGLTPVPVPNPLNPKELIRWLTTIKPHGVFLSGGNDVGEQSSRDCTEYSLLDYAEEHDLPVLGICRGMQIMALRAGEELVPVDGHVAKPHRLKGRMTRIVNSYHKLAVKRVPKDYLALAHANDGVLEAMCHKQLKWHAWMWHPERENPFTKTDVDRIRLLFSEGK